MPRAEKVTQHLPPIYGAEDHTTLLFQVIQAIARVMDDYENALFEVMRGHWVDHADVLADLTGLGALFDIRRREEEGLKAYRQRLKQTVAAYLAGVGTVQVVKDIAAATLGIAKESAAYDLIEIIENPPRLATSGWREVSYLSEWRITVQGFEPLDEQGDPKDIKPTILIAGVGERTVNPIVMSLTTETLVGFQGFVPNGQVLIIQPDGTASLDGVDVTERVYVRGVSLFDQAYFDQDYFSTQAMGTPTLPRGTSIWRYMAPFAHFAPPDSDYARFDQAMFAIPQAWSGIGFDQARFDQSTFAWRVPPKAGTWDWSRFDESVFALPSARVQLLWTECQPATFIVRMPWGIIEPPETDLDPRHLVKEEVDRVRAAGVRAIVEYQFASEKLTEQQNQQAGFRTESKIVSREHQKEAEALRLESDKTLAEHQIATDRPPVAGGIFDETYFDHSAFTEGRFQYRDSQQQHEAMRLASNKTTKETQHMTESLAFEGIFDTTRFDSSSFDE